LRGPILLVSVNETNGQALTWEPMLEEIAIV
jgi:hypothetical protein